MCARSTPAQLNFISAQLKRYACDFVAGDVLERNGWKTIWWKAWYGGVNVKGREPYVAANGGDD